MKKLLKSVPSRNELKSVSSSPEGNFKARFWKANAVQSVIISFESSDITGAETL